MKTIRSLWLPTVLFIVLLAAVAGYFLFRPQRFHGQLIEPPYPVPSFTLQSSNGPVSLSDFKGKVVVLYFGYTSCPDVCPVTLATLHQALASLGSKANAVQVLFVSVDWKRDTTDVTANYVSHFDPSFTGLSGTQEQIDAVTKDLGIFYLLNLPNQEGQYSVDHTASIRVLDHEGNLKLVWPDGLQPYEMAADLKALIAASRQAR